MKLIKQLSYLAFILLFVVLTACSSNEDKVMETENINKPSQEEDLDYQAELKEPVIVEKEITLSAIGDMLIHSRVYKDAKIENGYDFMPMLEQVKNYLNDSTIAVANQETMIGGETLGLSTYPSFNSPYEIGDALKEVGINVVSIANNHTLDRGEDVIQSAIEHWETIDMMYTGAYSDQADRNSLRIFETDEGISVAFLAYTYGTNGIPVPAEKDYLVNLIDKEIMKADIAEAKAQADVTVLSLHFGNEYERMPSEEQKELVQFAADQGVHAILGHHPHVLQPVDWVTGADGNKTFVAYSLGNFLSGQDEFYRQIGGVVKFTINKTIKDGEETIKITSPQFMPTFVKSKNNANYEVVPMFQMTNSELPDVDKHYKEIKTHMSQFMPELEFIEK